jgi:xylulokinase
MFLGIDLGTSEVKVLLLDRNHAVLGTAGSPLTVERPHDGWSEQSPQAWWTATGLALGQLRAAVGEAAWAQVAAIGLSGQMHGAVLLDASHQVLRPAILWNDTRSHAECQALMRDCPVLPDIAGNLAMPGFTAPKLAWVRRHEPEVFARVAKVLLPKDWLRWQMTRTFVSDPSDAAGTLWLDVARRDWSDELLALTGLNRSHMPDLVEGSAPSGGLSSEVAQAWGLKAGTPVAGGGGDNAASAVGVGAVQPGQGFVSLGTSGVLFVVTDQFRPNPASAVHAFCHAVPGRWHQMSVMLSAAASLAWWRQVQGGEVKEAALIDEVALAFDSDVERLRGAPLFLPYLSGERTPHNDADIRGSFLGLASRHTRADLSYAVLEGVAFGMRDGLLALQAAGTQVQHLGLVGGGSRSAWWAQLHADVLGIELATYGGGETGGALGAARLAWLAAGGDEGEVCRSPEISAVYRPHAERHATLVQRHRRFQAGYQALQSLN